jgi:hypothetical protein
MWPPSQFEFETPALDEVWTEDSFKTWVANPLPAGIILPLVPFKNALEAF